MIEVENLSKSYGSEKVLCDLNLNFTQGNSYGIVGSNGAGKTTLFKCICGLEKHSGKVNYANGTLKNDLGFLPTEPFMLNKVTGIEYLRLLCNSRKIRLEDSDEKNIFDLPLNKYASDYSTGMKKRLAFMGILLQKNHVYLLDEPFNGIDLESNILIKEILSELKKAGKIVILSSHFFSTLQDFCDVIYFLKKGEPLTTVGKNDFSKFGKELKTNSIDEKLNRFKRFYEV